MAIPELKSRNGESKRGRRKQWLSIDVPYLSQEGEYPTACEIVSAVMVLSYYGYDVSVDDFIDDYLPQADIFVDTETGLLTSTSPTQAFYWGPQVFRRIRMLCTGYCKCF